MPELPEVETIRQQLRKGSDSFPSLIGFQIDGALITWERSLATPAPVTFLSRLPGQIIKEISRRGKFFVFELSYDYLLVHLRMSGDLVVEEQNQPLDSYTRIAVLFNNGWRLAFSDTRKFGRIWLVEDPNVILAPLGPEPFDPAFSAYDFYYKIKDRKRLLKPLLLDQHFIAGIGNIYADEALFLAGLHPRTNTSELSKKQAIVLFEAIQRVLQDGIANNGASIDWVYRGGEQQHHFKVYGREEQPCYSCNTSIQKIMVGQRGTHFCPSCQKAL